MSISKKIEDAIKENGITRYKLAKDTGLPYTTLTNILSNRTRDPQVTALQAIANYFGKPLDYFTSSAETEEKTYYALKKKDEKDIAKKLEALMNDLTNDTSLAFMGEPMDEEDREILRISLENSLRLSKQMAKKKFTPKKHRS